MIDPEARLGPVVAVGHSCGGAVISGAAAGNPNVKALVYNAAFAPLAGEAVGAFLEQYPSLLGTGLVPDAAGLLTVDRTRFREIFAKDVDPNEARVMAATQKPIFGQIFGQATDAAAWQSIPSCGSPATAKRCRRSRAWSSTGGSSSGVAAQPPGRGWAIFADHVRRCRRCALWPPCSRC